MSCLLDTCVVSEVRKPLPNSGLMAWLGAVPPADCYLSVLTLGEIRNGVERIRAKDSSKAAKLDAWLRSLTQVYSSRVLPITATTCDIWGRMSPNKPVPVSDGLIAATAVEHGFELVTRNVADFARTGAVILNPFT